VNGRIKEELQEKVDEDRRRFFLVHPFDEHKRSVIFPKLHGSPYISGLNLPADGHSIQREVQTR